MPENQKKTTRRQYPPLYEKVVPIALILIGLAVVVILVIILAVALGLFPAG